MLRPQSLGLRKGPHPGASRARSMTASDPGAASAMPTNTAIDQGPVARPRPTATTNTRTVAHGLEVKYVLDHSPAVLAGAPVPSPPDGQACPSSAKPRTHSEGGRLDARS